MATLTQGKVAGQFLLSEAQFHYSRDNVVVATGSGKLSAGTVLGKITATGKFKSTDLTAVDGTAVASAVLLYNIDATSADVAVAVIVRDAEVKGSELLYHASVDQPAERVTKATELAAVGIIVR